MGIGCFEVQMSIKVNYPAAKHQPVLKEGD